MPDALDIVVYFFGSGLAFFVGVGLVLLGVSVSPFADRRPIALARNLAALIGSLLVALSAVPLDWWLYTVLALLTAGWLTLEWFLDGRKVVVGRCMAALIWLSVVAVELPYQFTPTLPALGNPKLFLIGDSVSAGMSDREKGRWPGLFADAHEIELIDLSRAGATVGSAIQQAQRIGAEPGLVLLEIGGNDLLGSTSAEQFEERIEALLDAVCRPDRTVVMLELPLPPFANRFGRIQRRWAHRRGVYVIPRRVFVSVLTAPGATQDGIHLTSSGHQRMAGTMWNVLRPAYGR